MKAKGSLETLQLQLQVHISLPDAQARNLDSMAEYVADAARQAEYREAAAEVRTVIVEYQERVRSLQEDQ
jgi:hypothetical protein